MEDATPEEDIPYVDFRTVAVFLDAVVRSLMIYEPQTIIQLVELVQFYYGRDAAELGWPPDMVADLEMMHTSLSYFMDYHIQQADADTRIDDEGA